MTQYVRAINIANNSIKSFVFDTNTANTLNNAAVAEAVAISANVSAQAVNTFVTLQVQQVANIQPQINTVSIADSSYTILDDTAANTSGGYLVIKGTNFQPGAIVMVGSGNTALSTAYVDPFTLRAEIPAISSGSYPVYVVNSNGGTAIKINGLTTSPFPVWVTGTNLANTPGGYDVFLAISATSDSAITYSNITAMPAGSFLSNVNTRIEGVMPLVENNTTFSITLKATDAENQESNKTFTVDVTPRYDLYAWGYNSDGQINGQASATVASVAAWWPTAPIWTGGSVRKSGHSYPGITMRKYDGTLWAWGINVNGSLGTGGPQSSINGFSSPVQIGSATDWSDTISTELHSLAIKTDGSLWVWGLNGNGQIGRGTRTGDQLSPAQIGSATDWSACSVEWDMSAAIKTNGTLWTWGYNVQGQLGHNSVISRSSPTQVGTETTWSKIVAFRSSMMAIKTDGTLWAWGYDDTGASGLDSVIYRSSPTQVGTNTNWRDIYATGGGTGAFAGAIKTDGTLWTWGYGLYGQLNGRTNATGRSSPVQVGTGTNWSSLSFGENHTLAIKTDGTLWSWGYNNRYQLGTNDTVSRSSPVQVGSSTKWQKAFGGFDTSFGIIRNQT